MAGAIGANAVSIFVPCHRVVGSDGTLKGYAGGIEVKRMLLELESAALGSSVSEALHPSAPDCRTPCFARQAVESAYCIFHRKY